MAGDFDKLVFNRENAIIDRGNPTGNWKGRCVLSVHALAIRTLGVVGLTLFAACLAGSTIDAAERNKDKGNVAGKLWEYTVTKRGKQIESGKFRADDFKLYHGGNQIGTYTKEGRGEFRLDITRGELKGTIELKLVQKEPRRVYAGEWEIASGGKAKIEVKFLAN